MININSKISIKNIIRLSVLAIVLLTVIVSLATSIYVVEEGTIGIVKRFGEAIKQSAPGLHFKFPLSDNIVAMDVRTRKYQLSMKVSTTGKNKETGEVELQVPSTVVISANWSVPKESVLDIYKEYGSLKEYEVKILDPRVLTSTKDIIAQYNIEVVISERQRVTLDLVQRLSRSLQKFKVKMTDVNIEDIRFPEKVKEAIQKKQVAKQNFQTEEYNLLQQNLKAQQEVNVAKAQAEAILLVSEAEAKAIFKKGKALQRNKVVIEHDKVKKWDGKLPNVLSTDKSAKFLFSVTK